VGHGYSVASGPVNEQLIKFVLRWWFSICERLSRQVDPVEVRKTNWNGRPGRLGGSPNHLARITQTEASRLSIAIDLSTVQIHSVGLPSLFSHATCRTFYRLIMVVVA
jgi:hypothetical protein